jgi:GT2 family glycosyltransferase
LPVSVVIPTWNGRRLLEQFLPSVLNAAAAYARTAAAIEVLIVDDGSTDGTLAWLDSRAAEAPVRLRTLRTEQNLGFGAACNAGMLEAAHPLVFLINNDLEVEPDAIAPLVQRFAREGAETLFAVHCRVKDFASNQDVGTGKMGGFSRGFLRVHRSYVTRDPEVGPTWTMFASGGSAMFHRQRFLGLGGFDPLFAPFYLEDVELSYRAWKRGWSLEYEPRSVVRHQFSSTIGPLAQRSIPRIAQRHRLMLHWIHLHDRRWLVSHVLWTLILLAAAPITFKPQFIAGFFDAIKRLPALVVRRREERGHAARTDRQVLAIFADLAKRPDIRAYDDPRELAAPHE